MSPLSVGGYRRGFAAGSVRAMTTAPALARPLPVRAATGRLEHLTPNWFASVMGTGIVATAAVSLPLRSPLLHAAAVVVWLLAAGWLAVLVVATGAQWAVYRPAALRHWTDPVTGQFAGAAAMALLTVGAGARTVGVEVLGERAAWGTYVVLWTAGTAVGLVTSVRLPLRLVTGAAGGSGALPLPAWLMPVVPPMVSATTGAALVTASGDPRAVLLGCLMLFGLSLVVGLLVTGLVLGRLLTAGLPGVQAAPTVWILLGVVGQSVTAANLLGEQAAAGFDPAAAHVLVVLGVVYGAVMSGFAVFVGALATALTVHAARRGLRFGLAWWSFTFPLGTCVTGAAALGRASGAAFLGDVAVALFAVLVVVWGVVATGTACRVADGRLPEPAV